jgi:thioredoxin reductase
MEINPAFQNIKRPNLAPKIPTVIIVGAGIAGLTLGMILERSKIPYAIYERTPRVKPLGRKLPFLTGIVILIGSVPVRAPVSNSMALCFHRFH